MSGLSYSNSYSKTITDFQRLLARVADYEAELPHTGDATLELAARVQELKDIKDRQEELWWAWRQATKELQQGMAAARLVASHLRHLVKLRWGRYDPRLVEIGVMPLRRNRKEHSAPVNGSEGPM